MDEYITEAHRKRAFAVMNEIADHCGYAPKGQFYDKVIKPAYNSAYDGDFSLKPGACKLDEYDMFLAFVMDIAADVGAQLSKSPMDSFHNIDKYLAVCIKNRICCITGLPGADIHHTETVGMGMDRTEVDHSKIPRMALCREKHTECHQMGQKAFDAKWHVHGVLCSYHNNAGHEEEPPLILAHQNIKTMRHSGDTGLLGVQFKSSVPGCNEKGVIVYRMDADEYVELMGQPDPKLYFIDNVYGKRKTVGM